MYVPAQFAVSDDVARDLLGAHGAADLITSTADGLAATMLPFVFDPSLHEHGALLGHVARVNDHWRYASQGESLAIVRGPDTYVSPSWYASKAAHGRVVPTWNYVTAHVYGDLVIHDDPVWLERQVRLLTDRHESGRAEPWTVDDAPAAFIEGQIRAIVGVEMVIRRIEAKAKLSQNRPAGDIEGIIAGLRADGADDSAEAVRKAHQDVLGPG